jgi:hypothetical protein
MNEARMIPPRGSWLLALAAAATIVAGWSVVDPHRRLEARQGDKVKTFGAETTRGLVETKLKIAQKAIRLIDSSMKIGAPVRASQQERYLWSRRLLEAQIFLSLGPDDPRAEDVEVYLALAKGPANPERLTAFREHLERMKLIEQLYRPLYEKGQFSTFDFATVEYNRMQAEVWISREQGRDAGAQKPAPAR